MRTMLLRRPRVGVPGGATSVRPRRCCLHNSAWGRYTSALEKGLPPPLLGTLADCPFAHDTIVNRVPNAILARTVELNADVLDTESRRRLDALIETLNDGDRAPLTLPHDSAPDIDRWWAKHLEPMLSAELTWAQAPWFTSETLAYRHVLAATGFFDSARELCGYDVFAHEKLEGLRTSLPMLREMAERHEHEEAEAEAQRSSFGVLSSLIHMSLWGNQADASLWSAGAHPDLAGAGAVGGGDAAAGSSDSRLLVDDTAAACAALLGSKGGGRVVLCCDNSGMELVCDMLLARWLLARGVASHIELVVKPCPFYVSDATEADISQTVSALAGDECAALARLGHEVRQGLVSGRISVRSDHFWSSPLAVWEMPAQRREALRGAALVIVKGDLQYRKLLGNRHWPSDSSFAGIVHGDEVRPAFPAPLLSCRTLKAPIVVGLEDDVVRRLDEESRDWRIDGTRGTIHFVGLREGE